MADNYVGAVRAQMRSKLFREIDRSVLASCAPERHHQIRESTFLIGTDALVHERLGVGQELPNTLLRLKILLHGAVFAGQCPESVFPSRVRQASRIKYKPSPLPDSSLGASR